MEPSMKDNTNHNCCCNIANLVEVDVVIERQCPCSPCIPQPSDGVAAYWQEDNSHIQLKSLSSPFCSCYTVAHHVKDISVAVLYEFPNEQPSHYPNPQCKYPQALPVVLQIVA
ncbi:Os05g0528050 [Oryza sativa Japonica Group]|uniref:Os05g0528050 protein n=1 Tax=Oryza sativa subsp. japonica TaxID=39947 RepID=A0A0P0WPN6_ORYSJ|nr:hypothetical protein EE612_030763 [Oryza sativa]BAS95007.1 Os05g0528050 [Oryza sativa Japonica Group]